MPETIYTSHLPEPPLPQLSLYDYLLPSSPGVSPLNQFDKARPAYIDGLTGRTLSRGDIEDGSLRLVTGLGAIGINRGSTACLWGLNSLEWVQAAFGCMAAGVTVSPANAAYAPHELAHQVNNSGSSAIFLDPILLPNFEKARSHFKNPFPNERVVLLCSKAGKPKGVPYKCLEELFGPRGEAVHLSGPEANSVAWMCYSSGTTGLPKGVETTHHNMTSQLQALQVAFQKLDSGKDVILGVLPLSHIFGLSIVLFMPFTMGVPVVVLPRFEEVSVLKAIEKHKITFGLIVPPIIIVLMHSKNLGKYDISSLHTLISGAAPLSEEVIDAFHKKVPTCHLSQGYGMTETSPVVHLGDGSRRGWVGQLIPTWEARLIMDDGTDAPRGERGELWVRGPSVMKGYHANPEATEGTMASGGWLRTGDVLIRSDDGWFKVVDRIKELIKYKGFQVPPAELEALLHTHPNVVDVGVIGVYDEAQATELPRAYVVVGPGSTDHNALAKEIQAWVAARVASHKRLRGGVVIIDAIPKSPSGKILRKDLRERAKTEAKAPPVQAKL